MSKVNALISADRPVIRIYADHTDDYVEIRFETQSDECCGRAAERVVQEGDGVSFQLGDAGDVAIGSFFPPRSMKDNGRDREMNTDTDSTTIRRIEFELEKAEHGMAMPYDAERVGQLRKLLVEARKRKLSAGLKARREQGRR